MIVSRSSYAFDLTDVLCGSRSVSAHGVHIPKLVRYLQLSLIFLQHNQPGAGNSTTLSETDFWALESLIVVPTLIEFGPFPDVGLYPCNWIDSWHTISGRLSKRKHDIPITFENTYTRPFYHAKHSTGYLLHLSRAYFQSYDGTAYGTCRTPGKMRGRGSWGNVEATGSHEPPSPPKEWTIYVHPLP